MDLGLYNDSDDGDYGEFDDYPAISRSKKKWKTLYKTIMDKQ